MFRFYLFSIYLLTFIIQQIDACHMGSVNFVRTSNVRPLDTVLEQIKQKLQISSLRCHQQCIDSINCNAYLYDSNALSCYLITNENLRINHQNLFRAPGWSHHRRICLTSEETCNQQWAFERFESYGSTQFNSIADKIVTNLNSEEACLNSCSLEKQFVCRSAVYDHFNKTCSLHSNNRNTAPDQFSEQQQGFNSNLLYIENLCVQQGCEIWRTHFELVSGMQAVGAHYTKRTDNLQPHECIDICKKDNNCKSINIDYEKGICEFFDEQNTVNMENKLKDQEQQFNSQQSNQQFNLQQQSNLLQKSNQQKAMPDNQQMAANLQVLQAKNRSLSIFQTEQQNYQQNYQQQAINDQKTNKLQLKSNHNVNYFVKICLSELNSCDTHWSFVRQTGKRLDLVNGDKNLDGLYYSERLISNITTKEQCQSACLKYSLSNQELSRNGQRFGAQFSNPQFKNQKESKDLNFVCRALNFNSKTSTCKLLSYNQHTTYGKAIRLEDDKSNDYIENTCVQETKGFCNWKTTYQKKLLFADRVIVESNLTSCKERCLKQNLFNCRSLSFEPESGLCSLSHHSSVSVPNLALIDSSTSVYAEIATCFKINVECRSTDMVVHLNTNMPFKGRVYARGNSKNCSLDVNNSLDFDLPISLNESICGTVFNHDSEQTFSNVLVIQGNDQVLTSLDKAIAVKCSYDLDSITGEAVLFINELPLTDTGRSSADLPDLSLHVMDINGKDRSEVSLGELLKVQVKLSDEDTYGVFIRNLIAKDEFGNNLTLIDKMGCPVQTKMMREVKRINSKTKQLESYFEAFSFTGSSILILEGEIETCLNNCLPVQCQVVSGRSNDDYETVVSYGRRKREYNILDSKILSQSLKVHVNDFEQKTDLHFMSHQIDQKSTNKSEQEQLFLSSIDEHKRKDKRVQMNYLIDELGHFCFEPTSLAILSGFTLIIQGVFFSIAIILFYKTRFEDKKYEINF